MLVSKRPKIRKVQRIMRENVIAASESFKLAPELDGALGFWLRSALQISDKMFAETFELERMRPALYAILMSVAANPGCLSMDICSLMNISPNNMVPFLDELVKRGFISRGLGRTDKRVRHLNLTAKGRLYTGELRKRHQGIEDQLAERLGSKKLKLLIKLLSQYVKGS